MRYWLVLLSAAVVMLHSGCVAPKVSVSANKRVGVVALVPDKVETKYVSIIAFTNQSGEGSAPGQAQFVTSTTVAALRAQGFDAVAIPLPPAAFAQYQQAVVKYAANGFFSKNPNVLERELLRPVILKAVAEQRLNLIAVARPVRATGGGEASVGVGNFGFGTVGGIGSGGISVYSRVNVGLYEPSNFNRVKAAMYGTGNRVFAEVPFEKNFDSYPAEVRSQLLAAMRELYQDGLAKTAKDMTTP